MTPAYIPRTPGICTHDDSGIVVRCSSARTSQPDSTHCGTASTPCSGWRTWTEWRGPGWTILPSGEKHTFTQTERIGPFLDGSVKVIEGRGYDPDGKVTFNAFGTISFNPATKVYTLHSHAMGNVGDFVLALTFDGYTWDIPAGPMTIHYTTVIKNGAWSEVGDRIVSGKEPVRFFEMNLKRVGDTDWPAAGAISPK
jgi:hypothetical protein